MQFVVRVLCGGIRGSFLLRHPETGHVRLFETENEANEAAQNSAVIVDMDWGYKVEEA